jgi:hypothetical protein
VQYLIKIICGNEITKYYVLCHLIPFVHKSFMTDSNGELDAESSEISSVMTELKQLRVEQDNVSE